MKLNAEEWVGLAALVAYVIASTFFQPKTRRLRRRVRRPSRRVLRGLRRTKRA